MSNDPFLKLLEAHRHPEAGAAAVQSVLGENPVGEASPNPEVDAPQEERPPGHLTLKDDPLYIPEPDRTPAQWSAVEPEKPEVPFTDADEDSVPPPAEVAESNPSAEDRTGKKEPSKGVPLWEDDGYLPDALVDEEPFEQLDYSGDNLDDDSINDEVRGPRSWFSTDKLSPSKLFDNSPPWKRPALIAAGAAASALAVALLFGGSPASQNTASRGSVAPAAPEETVPPNEAAIIELRPENASSSCPPGGTSSALAFSSKPENAWVCGRANNTDGAIMNIVFSKPVIVKSVSVMPGWNYVAPNGTDKWNQHRLITKILWRIGGKQFVQNINPVRSEATLTLPDRGVATSVMSMTILQTIRPDAVLSEGVSGTPSGGLLPEAPVFGESDTSKADESTAINSVVIRGVDP